MYLILSCNLDLTVLLTKLGHLVFKIKVLVKNAKSTATMVIAKVGLKKTALNY